MNRKVFCTALVLVTAVASRPLAQKVTELGVGNGGSPHVRAEWAIDGANIAIEYGRPSLKGRTPGRDVDPYESSEWRTGADEQTAIVTDKPLKIGTLSVPAGRHGLYTVSIKGTWHLIVHTREKGWGIPYPGAAGDRGRVPMTMSSPSATAEQLRISIVDTPTGATLHIDWGSTRASIPFTVG